MLLGIFLVCKFQIIILKTTEVAETQTLLGHMYKVKILNNTGLCKSSNTIWSEFCDIYAHAKTLILTMLQV